MKHIHKDSKHNHNKMAYEFENTNDQAYYLDAQFINDESAVDQANFIMKHYVYCGYHTENHTETGCDKILHYISKTTLGTRDVKSLGKWEYELEVWPSDRYYSYLAF